MAPSMEPLLDVQDLRTHFFTDQGVLKSVDGVSFSIRPGEMVGVVGESGCGKSVMSMSMLRLIPQPPGRIVGGKILLRDPRTNAVVDLVTLPDRELRRIRGRRVAMIFQEPMTSLNPVYTIGQQIAEAVMLHQEKEEEEAREIAIRMLEKVRIPDPTRRVDEYPHQLSGGMKQRVMIAMALSCEPDLLIADEPTTALDVTIQAQILELLKQLQVETGLAVLLITHDLGVVAETCDRVLVMYAGRVAETGPTAEVFASPRHPYTRGLLGSLPGLVPAGARLATIPGMVPSPLQFPTGCRFRSPVPWDQLGAADRVGLPEGQPRPRCSSATAACAAEPPEVLVPSPDPSPGSAGDPHRVWCHHPGGAP